MAHCEDRNRLADELARAVKASATAVKALRVAKREKHTQALDDAERTGNEVGKARRALQAHILKHRC